MDIPFLEDDQPLDSEENGHVADLPAGELVEIPDGTEVVLFGDLDESKDYFHKQGENDYGFGGTCGLVSCGDVLNQFGRDVTENDIVIHAVDCHECLVVPGSRDASGGTTVNDQAQILTDFGVPAHVEIGMSLETLAGKLAEGHGTIIEVNAGELWDDAAYYDAGQPNHAVTVTGIGMNPENGVVEGIWINDSGRGDFARYLSSDHAAIQSWVSNGGMSVVTDSGRA